MERLPLSLRLGNAAVSYIRYIGKTLAPHKLAIFYPHPGKWPAWMVAGSAILLAAFSIAALRTWRRYPALTFGWLWFLLTLIPVLGIVQAGMQAMADRFAYVPMIGFLVLIVWAASELLRDHSRVAAALGAAALAGCIAVTGIQLRYWQNNETLWRHALDVTSNNFIAHYGLGYVLIGQEKYDEALFHTEKALRLKPDLVLSHYQIAVIKDRQGKYDEAIPEYEQALKMKWDWAEAHRALLNAYYHAGKTNLAINHLKKLVDAAPQNPGGHFELAEALNAAGNFPEAVQHYRDVARLAPLWAIPRNNLAWILATNPDATLRNGQEAVALAERACELTAWNQPVMIGTLAAAYAENGQFDKATEMAQRAANLADSIGEKAIAAKNRELLVLYTEKKPYRDTPK